ncbi:MAG TPA: hypothetical protein VJL60_04895 [Gammaproteobacteria bacterium]|nr:hypothetical protein [Gammaproteobacteria bacterium]
MRDATAKVEKILKKFPESKRAVLIIYGKENNKYYVGRALQGKPSSWVSAVRQMRAIYFHASR